MSSAQWVTLPNLGSFIENHDFNLTPLVLEFYADQGSAITALNGSLPSGLEWKRSGNTVVITGESTGVSASTNSSITLRINDTDGTVDDRTFTINIYPVLISPSWEGQEPFLGYVAVGDTGTFAVAASASNGARITYRLVRAPGFAAIPPGMSINASTGVITFATVAPIPLPDSYERTYTVTVRAFLGTLYEDIAVTATVLGLDHLPAWLTSPGLLDTYTVGRYVEKNLQAFDPLSRDLAYISVSASNGFPFTLTSTGFIYGKAPVTANTTTYQIVVSAAVATRFVGYVAGTLLTVTKLLSGSLAVGQLLLDDNANDGWPANTTIVGISSGNGGLGTYVLSNSITLGSSVQQIGSIYAVDPSKAYDAQRTFDITVQQTVASSSLTWVNPAAELGTYHDGQIITVYVGATSTLSNTVIHTFVGGTLPPDLILNGLQGNITGYLEYHPQARDYYFEVQASDGFQTLTRQYHISVIRSINYKFMDVYVPIQGEMRQALLDTRSLMIPTPYLVPFNNSQPQPVSSQFKLISGLNLQQDAPDAVMSVANLEMCSTTLLIGGTGNANVTTKDYTLFYRAVIDAQANASPLASRVESNVQVTDYHPTSLNNMRAALSTGIGYASGGLGTGSLFIPVIDPQTTGLASVSVVNPGSGYFFSPEITVTGTGNGAVVTSNITVQGVTVIDPGYGWIQGQQFNVLIANDQTVVLEAASVNMQDGLTAVSVINGNSFDLFPQGKKTITNGEGSYAEVTFDLGVSSVTVVSPGTGYSITNSGNTIVSSVGTEPLPSWQSSWQPFVTIGTVYGRYNSLVRLNATAAVESLMSNIVLPVDMLYVTMQGRSWTGNTTFDDALTQLDGGETRLVEWIEPLDTVFDANGNTTFDVSGTRFDGNSGLGSWAYTVWGTTVWEPTTTIFDVYGQQIEDVDPVTASTTVVTKLYRLQSQQIGSFNAPS